MRSSIPRAVDARGPAASHGTVGDRMVREFDVVVIGAGTGGRRRHPRRPLPGLKVGVVERQ